MEDFGIGGIELPEWLFNFLNKIISFFARLKSALKIKRIIGVEFITKEGTREARYIGTRYHIDDHAGDCLKDAHCQILPLKKIEIIGNKVLLFFDDNKVVYQSVDIRTTHYRKM